MVALIQMQLEELTNSRIYKSVKMEELVVGKEYIMLYHSINKVLYINVVTNNEDYFGYECLESPKRFSITSYKNIFEHYFLFYKEINNRDVRELKFLSHLSARNINVTNECILSLGSGVFPKTNVLSSLDLASYISTFL